MAEHIELWPIVICEDRYNGTYSGGRWLATSGERGLFDSAPYGGDIEANRFWRNQFWRSTSAARIGVGDTPEAALANLVSRWEAAGKPTNFVWWGHRG